MFKLIEQHIFKAIDPFIWVEEKGSEPVRNPEGVKTRLSKSRGLDKDEKFLMDVITELTGFVNSLDKMTGSFTSLLRAHGRKGVGVVLQRIESVYMPNITSAIEFLDQLNN